MTKAFAMVIISISTIFLLLGWSTAEPQEKRSIGLYEIVVVGDSTTAADIDGKEQPIVVVRSRSDNVNTLDAIVYFEHHPSSNDILRYELYGMKDPSTGESRPENSRCGEGCFLKPKAERTDDGDYLEESDPAAFSVASVPFSPSTSNGTIGQFRFWLDTTTTDARSTVRDNNQIDVCVRVLTTFADGFRDLPVPSEEIIDRVDTRIVMNINYVGHTDLTELVDSSGSGHGAASGFGARNVIPLAMTTITCIFLCIGI